MIFLFSLQTAKHPDNYKQYLTSKSTALVCFSAWNSGVFPSQDNSYSKNCRPNAFCFAVAILYYCYEKCFINITYCTQNILPTHTHLLVHYLGLERHCLGLGFGTYCLDHW